MDHRPESSSQARLKVKVLYYPFMGTDIDTERLILLARLCYSPMDTDQLESVLTGDKPSKEEVGRFIRGLIKSGHLGVLEHWYTTFAVEGYSRISSQQNDRHRLMKVFKEPGVMYFNEPVQASADVSQPAAVPAVREGRQLQVRHSTQLLGNTLSSCSGM